MSRDIFHGWSNTSLWELVCIQHDIYWLNLWLGVDIREMWVDCQQLCVSLPNIQGRKGQNDSRIKHQPFLVYWGQVEMKETVPSYSIPYSHQIWRSDIFCIHFEWRTWWILCEIWWKLSTPSNMRGLLLQIHQESSRYFSEAS